ncbi:MAG: carboxypeptidase regulatory-like domain-containing protein [Acidobacteriaceae bacterium]
MPIAAILPAAMAATITGTVVNRTTQQPAAGDPVSLVSPAQGMQEVAETTTNAQGEFSLNAPAGGQYLLRVVHDMASYYTAVPDGSQPVTIDVYNAAAHVTGVSTELVVLRAQTDPGGSTLNITEDLVVNNASKPPMTQYSKAPFDVYLPDGAVVDGTAAKGPNGMPTSEDLQPQSEKGLYSVMFPIKPGETQIEIAYHFPYSGSKKLAIKMAGAAGMFAVSVPKEMTFTGSGRFTPTNGEPNASTYLMNNLQPGQVVEVAFNGSGQFPPSQGNDASGQSGQDQASAGGQADDAPGRGLGVPLDPNGTHEPLSTKYKWWILGIVGLLLVAAAGVLLRKPTVAPMTPVAAAEAGSLPVGTSEVLARAGAATSLPTTGGFAGGRAQILAALKEELFTLETDRLQERIDEASYLQTKAALELVLRRALQRDGAHGGASAASTSA